jgi:membrane fusion protein, heavy metal efflux system
MTYLQSFNTRMFYFTIILLFVGIIPTVNVAANQKHEGCQDSHKDEICSEHGVPESECSLCNPDMKIKKPAPDIERGYEEFLKKQCEHNVPIIECNGCRHEVGAVKVDKSILGEIITIKKVELFDIDVTHKATGEVGPNRDRFVIVSPRVSGVVKELFVDWGTHVKKGQKLAVLDSIELGEGNVENGEKKLFQGKNPL